MKTKLIVAAIVLASAGANATNGNNVQQQIDDLRAGLHQVHMNTLQKYSESWGLEDRANIAKLQDTKVDKSVFTADQQRQDKALNDAVASQAETDAKQTSDLKSYADKKATSAYQTAVAHTDAKVARADADRAKGDAALQAQITRNLVTQAERDAGQDDHINAVQGAAQAANDHAGNLEVRADAAEGAIRETNAQLESDRRQSIDRDAVNAQAITAESLARAEANVKLAAGISVAQSTGDYAVSRSDAALRNAAANTQAIRSTNEKVAGHSRTLANHEQRLGELERNTSSRFANIDKRIDENKRSANAGIAGVAAMSNIPQVTGGARFSAGVGIGQRGSEQAVAVGFSSQLTDSVIGKVSVANDSQQQWTVGAGLAVQW